MFEFLEATKLILGLSTSIVFAISGVFYWIHRRVKAVAIEATNSLAAAQKSAAESVGHLEGELKVVKAMAHANDRRLVIVEGEIIGVKRTLGNMPDKDDFHRLSLLMATSNGSLLEMRAIMDGNAQVVQRIETAVTRHETHLMNAGDRK